MNKEYLEDTLTLMTLVILIDEKVYPEEVETFATAITRLSHMIDPKILFTNSMAKDWFHANRAAINSSLRRDDQGGIVKTTLKNLKTFKNLKEVFYNMIRIAHSDQEYHRTEHVLIQEASMIWNIPYSVEPPNVTG